MRIFEMVIKGEMLSLIFCQILSMDSERNCMETSVENLYLDIGPYRVKGFLF